MTQLSTPACSSTTTDMTRTNWKWAGAVSYGHTKNHSIGCNYLLGTLSQWQAHNKIEANKIIENKISLWLIHRYPECFFWGSLKRRNTPFVGLLQLPIGIFWGKRFEATQSWVSYHVLRSRHIFLNHFRYTCRGLDFTSKLLNSNLQLQL
jgi:hypothetical protein